MAFSSPAQGYGQSLNMLAAPGARSQLEMEAAAFSQSVRRNPGLAGIRYSATIAYDRALTPEVTGRLSIRGLVLDARAKPEALVQVGGDLLIANNMGFATVFGQFGHSRLQGRAPILLFGRARRDSRTDYGAGLVVHRLRYRGLSPLVRVTRTQSASNIAIYDFRRTRAELGLTREF